MAVRITLSMPDPGSAGRRNLLGPSLRRLRESRDLTQAEVCSKLQLLGWDISRQVLSFVEDGSRLLSDAELFGILKVLGSSPKELEGDFREFMESLDQDSD